MRCCFRSSVFCPMLCIYKNERTKGKIFCPRPSMTSAFVSPCQNVIAAHFGALPEPGRKPVHGVEGGKHCHHEYSSDADLGFIRRHVLSFSNQTFFVKELKEDFTVLSMLMLMPSWKLDIMMYVCMNVCRTFSKAFDCSQKKGCGRARPSGMLQTNKNIQVNMTQTAVRDVISDKAWSRGSTKLH